jgi:hypothetical protein
MHELSRGLSIFVGVLALLGSMALAASFVVGTFFTNAPFLILTLFTIACSPLSVSLGSRVRLSTLQVFVLAAVLLAGTPEAVILAALGALSTLVVARPHASFHQAIAMVTGYPLEALLAGWAFTFTGGEPGDFTTGASLVALLFASLTYYLAHTLMAAALVGLEERTPVLVVWFDRYAWTLPSFLSAGATAALAALVREFAGLHAFVLLVPFVLLLFQHYRLRAERDRQRAILEAEIGDSRGGTGQGSRGEGGAGARVPAPLGAPLGGAAEAQGRILSEECPPEGVRRRRFLHRGPAPRISPAP